MHALGANNDDQTDNQMFDPDLVTMPPIEFLPDWLLPPQQFYVDESERSDSASHSASHSTVNSVNQSE